MSSASYVACVRKFNRFYTRLIGTLNEGLLDGPFSLAEARLLYELAHRSRPSISELAQAMDVDLSYVSRILQKFVNAKLVRRQRSESDRRQFVMTLTAKGQEQFDRLNARSDEQSLKLLSSLSVDDQTNLVEAMRTIENLLGADQKATPIVLRPHRPGDMGWIIERHGTLYAQEYGWDERFEALVARITADFINNLDHARERCWIAEQNGRRLGCVMLVRDVESDPVTTARLRLLLVDPFARGSGLGSMLVRQCTAFARTAGYSRIVLWTNDVLKAARRIYEHEGYRLLREKPHQAFGKSLLSQDWQLDL